MLNIDKFYLFLIEINEKLIIVINTGKESGKPGSIFGWSYLWSLRLNDP